MNLAAICAAALLVACASTDTANSASAAATAQEHPEPGLQGQWAAGDPPGAILAQPYVKGARLVGHTDLWQRDTNLQLSWVDHCAYVSSTMPNFLGWGMTAEPSTYGVAVIDVRNPAAPQAVRVLRDRGALYSAEAMDAVEAPGRKVLAAGTYEGGARPEDARWLSLYDVSDCASPKLMSEYQWPEKVHAITLAPNGKRVYATHIEPFTGRGGIHVLDIIDLAHPRYLGRFGITRADGTSFEFAPHEISVSADEKRIYAGAISSSGNDLNIGIRINPPSAEGLGPDAGGVYILDNSDIAAGRVNPRLRLVGTALHAGWHSVMIARIGGRPMLVGAGELGACPGAWPRITDISDEAHPRLAGEFRLQMNHKENCPPRSKAEQASGGIVGDVGTATLHYNDVDSENHTRLGLFNFMWAGMRIADLRDPTHPVEIAYFKPGDACTGHARYVPRTGHIWFTCGKSGFYVIALKPEVRAALRP